MKSHDVCVAIYSSHDEAEEAVKRLERAGFDMKTLSIVGRDYHSEEHVVGYYNTGDRMKYWGKLGAFWGGVWGLLIGAAFFWVPGLGAILVGGPLVASILGGLEGAAVGGGLSVLGAGLFSLGIPKDSILRYETALKADDFLLVVHDTYDQVERAKDILSGTAATEIDVHGGARDTSAGAAAADRTQVVEAYAE